MTLGASDAFGIPIDGKASEGQGVWREGLPTMVWCDRADDGDLMIGLTTDQ